MIVYTSFVMSEAWTIIPSVSLEILDGLKSFSNFRSWSSDCRAWHSICRCSVSLSLSTFTVPWEERCRFVSSWTKDAWSRSRAGRRTILFFKSTTSSHLAGTKSLLQLPSDSTHSQRLVVLTWPPPNEQDCEGQHLQDVRFASND